MKLKMTRLSLPTNREAHIKKEAQREVARKEDQAHQENNGTTNDQEKKINEGPRGETKLTTTCTRDSGNRNRGAQIESVGRKD